jgi:hypothetical protein
LKYKIEILRSEKINLEKWDQLVSQSSNGLIYAKSNYLDFVSDHWDGLVINDYETIMPIPWRTKAGIKYAYTPAFTQQLGFIGAPLHLPIERIIKRIYSTYRYGSILLNAGNGITAKITEASPKPNLLLNLQRPFEQIKLMFRKDHLQNAQKALNNGLIYTEIIPITKAISFYQSINGTKTPHIVGSNYLRLEKYCNIVLQFNQHCFTRAVMNDQGDLLSSALFLKDEKRIYNIMNATSEMGRTEKANHLLFYQVIQEFSEKELILDFEGSSIPGIKQFYEGFGCYEEVYYLWHFNKLPFPLSLIP